MWHSVYTVEIEGCVGQGGVFFVTFLGQVKFFLTTRLAGRGVDFSTRQYLWLLQLVYTPGRTGTING